MKTPCYFDHNGECLICDCWIDNCAYQRYLKKDYKYENKEELDRMFKHLDDDISDWDVTLMDGLEDEPYEDKIETYSIPIYENGVKTEFTVDGVIGDEKYIKLIELGNGKDLPTIINTNTKQ